MRSAALLVVVALSCVYVAETKDLIVGTSFNNRLQWQEKAVYDAIPLNIRVQEVFYNSDPTQQNIKGIIARDLDHTDAVASISAGGIGFSYANIQLKSERGSGLKYQIEIYG